MEIMSISIGDKIILYDYNCCSGVHEVIDVQPSIFRVAKHGYYFIDNRLKSWRKLSDADILELKLLGKLTFCEP